jgi:hypothetical protein
VYEVYAERPHAFDRVLADLPSGNRTIGYMANDFPETALWRPFGSRMVKHVTREDTTETLKQRGIEYILVNTQVLQSFGSSFEAWLAQIHGNVISQPVLKLRATPLKSDWYLVRVPPGNLAVGNRVEDSWYF